MVEVAVVRVEVAQEALQVAVLHRRVLALPLAVALLPQVLAVVLVPQPLRRADARPLALA